MSAPMIAGVLLLVVCSSSAAMMMGGGEEKEDPVVPKTAAETAATAAAAAAPIPDIMLEDKIPYAYEAGKLYGCTSGKDVGCLFRAEANGIAAAAGMYDPVGKKCEKGGHVYCVNDKTVTYAQYADNTTVKTKSGWQNNNHRYVADGARCKKPENTQCQDDQSIASYQGWGGGNTAKITTKATERQCVDNAFLYCPDSAI
jgi:hypothetical protein